MRDTVNEDQSRVLPRDWREAFQRIRVQLLVAVLLFVLYILSAAGILPPHEQLYALAAKFFGKYGVFVVGPISFTENLVGLNIYFPGSVAILTSMALTAGDPLRAIRTFFAIVISAFLAHNINYLVGRRIGEGDIAKRRYGSLAATNLIFLSASWHPHFAALACIDAGAQRMPYVRFVSTFGPWFLVWNIFWGVVMYNFGSTVIQESQGSPVFLVFLVAWSIWDLFSLGHASRVVMDYARARKK